MLFSFLKAYMGDDCDGSEPVTPSINVHKQNCLLCNKVRLQLAPNYVKVGEHTKKI